MNSLSRSLPLALASALGLAASADVEQVLAEDLQQALPGTVVKAVKESAAAGLYEVELEGGTYLYTTADGRHFVLGDLYEIVDGAVVSVTEAARVRQRLALFADIDREQTLDFSPAAPRASVFVFTDTDCGFCRRLHADIEGYKERGVEIRYLAYPRAGITSGTYDDMVSAWCADDPNRALTALKRGEGLSPRTCANPVAAQHALGQRAGITGTPTFVLPDGQMIPGLVSPAELASVLGLAVD